MTSNTFPKPIEEYFQCSYEHCYIMPSIFENKCCKEVEIIPEKLINENCNSSTSSFNKLCLNTELLIFSLIPACAVIAIRKRFAEDDERYKGFHEANMPTVFRQE